MAPVPDLDTAAAELYLLGIPLLSLNEDVRIGNKWRERSYSVDRAAVRDTKPPSKEKAKEGRPEHATVLSERLDLGALRLGVENIGLDIEWAEEFLTSLQVEDTRGRVDSLAGASQSLAGTMERMTSDKSMIESGREHQAGQDKAEAPEKLLTVVGGWRKREDLDRLTPNLVRRGLIGGRIIMTAGQTSVYITSTQSKVAELPGQLDQPERKGKEGRSFFWRPRSFRRQVSMNQMGTSYAAYLVPSDGGKYDPDFLDDQSLRQGKHHTVLRLEAYHVSLIPFVRPRRLKEEQNDLFRTSHPNIHYSMTLSKLRNLQKDLRNIALEVKELDISTIAMAWVYFEKLVLADYVRKGNRKLLAGACLVLAFKFNQQFERTILKKLYSCIRGLDRKDQLDQGALRDAEMKVFVWLEFGLHLPRAAMAPHLNRMLSDLGYSFTDYYGADQGRLLRQEWRQGGCGSCEELLVNEDEYPVLAAPVASATPAPAASATPSGAPPEL